MLRSVLGKTLRDQRRGLLGWSAGLVVLALYVMLVYPSVRSNSSALKDVIDKLPAALRATIGAATDYTSPSGYLHTELYFFMLPLLLMFFSIGQGSRAIAGEEENGTLDLLLSLPLSRTRLVLEKLGAMAVAVAVVSMLFWCALLAGTRIAGMDIGVLRLLEATVSAALLALLFGAVALLVGCAIGRRGTAIAVASVLALATYLLNSLGTEVGVLQPYRKLSPFYWYIDNQPLLNGLDALHVVATLLVTTVAITAAVLALRRRDLAS